MKHDRSISRIPKALVAAALGLTLLAAGSLAAEAKKPAPRPSGQAAAALSSSDASLQKEIDAMVVEVLARANQGTRSVESNVPTKFEGVAWDAGEGLSAGTSRYGTQLNQAILASLSDHGVPVQPVGVTGRSLGGRLLKGGFRILKTGLELSLAVVEAGTGQQLSKVTKLLRTSMAVVAGDIESVLPPGSENLKSLIRLVKASLATGPAPFGLRVSTDRGAHGAFTVGEKLHVLVESDRDCYLRLYHVSWTDKSMTLVFPNEADTNPLIKAGSLKVIPAEGSGVSFEAAEPTGVDALVAIASEQPFEDEPLVAAQLGGSASTPASQTREVQRVGPYLVAQGVSEQRARQIMTRGLFVRVPKAEAPSGSNDPAPAEPAGAAPAAPSTDKPSEEPPAAPDADKPTEDPPAAPDVDKPTEEPPAAPDVDKPTEDPPAAPDVDKPAGDAERQKLSGTSPPGQLQLPKKVGLARAVCFFTTMAPAKGGQ